MIIYVKFKLQCCYNNSISLYISWQNMDPSVLRMEILAYKVNGSSVIDCSKARTIQKVSQLSERDSGDLLQLLLLLLMICIL